jgi:hypothetical protein
LDEGLGQQVLFDLEALETATGRTFTADERKAFIDVQTQANRWTYLGSEWYTPSSCKPWTASGQISDSGSISRHRYFPKYWQHHAVIIRKIFNFN